MKLRAVSLVAAALVCACSSKPSESQPVGASVPTSLGAPVAAIARATRPSPPVIFIGLDGGDWELLDDYVQRGVMPNLARLVREGTSGVLETIRPPLSPLVWTTMMTGVSPVDHGILDFVELNPDTGAKEPIASSARRAPAIWNMTTNAGKRAAVFGLWATFPAEPVNGLMVSDRLFTFLFKESAPPAGIVYPADRETWARSALERAEESTDLSALRAYLPWLTETEYRQHADASDPYGHPVSALRRILIETRVYDELGREAFQKDHPDLTVIYLQGTDSIGHVFAPFAPPKQEAVTDEDFAKYSGVPERYFRAIDERLGAYRTLAENAHAVLMLASDHGFFWNDGRPSTLSSNAMTTAAKWHRKEGMYLLWGSGIAASPKHDKRGGVDQVCATLLTLLGLPPSQRAQGVALPGVATSTTPPVNYATYYRPSADPNVASPGRGNADALAKLKSLGYIADSGPSRGRAGLGTRTPDSYNNEGVILKEHGKATEAIAAFEKALAANPNLSSALWNLSDLLFANKDFDRSDKLLVQAFKNDLPEGTKFLIGRAIGYQRAGQADRSLRLVNGGLEGQPENPELWLFRGRYRVDAGDCSGATADFQKAEQLQPRQAAAFSSEGLARMCAGDSAGARKAFARSLELDPNQPRVREFLKTLGRTP